MNTHWMPLLATWADAWSDRMLRACWQGGLLILAVWLLCRLAVRLSPAVRCGLWWLAWDNAVHLGWLGAYLVLQALRAWVLLSLGGRWTTRIIVVPGETPVRRGPYRFVPHPNYLVVVGEIAVLPLVFGLALYALVFSALNAAILGVRIRAESLALGRI